MPLLPNAAQWNVIFSGFKDLIQTTLQTDRRKTAVRIPLFQSKNKNCSGSLSSLHQDHHVLLNE